MDIFKHAGRVSGIVTFFLFASAVSLSADSFKPSRYEQIKQQLRILEELPGNLSPEQQKAIRNIRDILENRKTTPKNTPPEAYEACKREIINNDDGTFTYTIVTDEEIQRWLLPINSNEFNQGLNWHNARKKAATYDLNGINGWTLPSREVLYGIYRVRNDCPGKFIKITGNPIIRGQFYHFAYWTSNEYSFVDSPVKLHADTVSLYTGNVIHERKNNIGMLWPAKLMHVESRTNNKNTLLGKRTVRDSRDRN